MTADSIAPFAKHDLIAAQLRGQIESGSLAIGDDLPSESELQSRFGVSRGPIRQALATLRSEGLIETTQGRPPRVRAQPLAQSIDDFFSFSSWVRAQGKVPGQRTFEIARRRATPALVERMGLAEGEFVVEIVRLRLIDGIPTMIERSAFHDSIGKALLNFDTDRGSIYEYLIDNGAELDEGTHVVDAVPAAPLDAELLGVETGSPLLRVRRVTRSRRGLILETSDDRYRPDHATLLIHNSRNENRPTPIVARTTHTVANA